MRRQREADRIMDARQRFWEARKTRMQALVAYNLADDPDIQDACWHEAQAAYHRMRAAIQELKEAGRRSA